MCAYWIGGLARNWQTGRSFFLDLNHSPFREILTISVPSRTWLGPSSMKRRSRHHRSVVAAPEPFGIRGFYQSLFRCCIRGSTVHWGWKWCLDKRRGTLLCLRTSNSDEYRSLQYATYYNMLFQDAFHDVQIHAVQTFGQIPVSERGFGRTLAHWPRSLAGNPFTTMKRLAVALFWFLKQSKHMGWSKLGCSPTNQWFLILSPFLLVCVFH